VIDDTSESLELCGVLGPGDTRNLDTDFTKEELVEFGVVIVPFGVLAAGVEASLIPVLEPVLGFF
jgi:hypothetical protein